MRRVLHTLIVLALLTVVLQAASVTDDFNRANENPLAGNWTTHSSGMKLINTVEITPINFSSGSYQGVSWSSGVNNFGDDQFSKGVIGPGNASIGGYQQIACVRMTGSGGSFDAYCIRFGEGIGQITLVTIDDGIATLEVNFGGTTADGDEMCIDVVGTAPTILRGFKNGVQLGSDETAGTDLTGGQPGLGGDFTDYDVWTSFNGGDGLCSASAPAAAPKLLLLGVGGQ